MRIIVHAKPAAKTASVERLADGTFVVAVREPPREGRANAAMLCAIADEFGVPINCVRLVAGHTARQKLVEITT